MQIIIQKAVLVGVLVTLMVLLVVQIGQNKNQNINNCNYLKIDGYFESEFLKTSSCNRAVELYKRDTLSHFLTNGVDFSGSISLFYQLFHGFFGENLARNFNNKDDVIKAWMNSPSHRKNLENESFINYGFSEYKGYYVLHLSN